MATGRVPTTANSPLTTKGDLFTYDTSQARLAVGSNGETLVADSSTSTGLRYQATQSTQNYIVNGGQDIWQRGTSFASGASAIYTADRWQLLRASGASGATVSRQTGTTGFEYAARVQRDSGNTGTGVVYYATTLESSQSIPLANAPVVVSFYARAGANYSSGSSALTLSVATGTGTNQNIFSGFTGQVTVGTTVTLTTSWQRFSYTTTLASSATQIAAYFSYTPVGTASTNDWFEVTGVQLEVGSVPTTFRRSGGTLAGELAACQRYYWRFNSNGTSASVIGLIGIAYNTTDISAVFKCPVTMRTTPTSLDYANVAVLDVAASRSNITSVTILDSSPDNVRATLVGSGFTAQRSYLIYNQSGAAGYVGYSAEL